MTEGHFLTREPTEEDLAFRRKIAENPLDQLARDVYSDFLEETGEQAEADRQRQWSVSYPRIRLLADCDQDEDEGYAMGWAERRIDEILEKDGEVWFNTINYPNDDASIKQFYDDLEIVTGRRIPADKRKTEDDYPFSCSC